MPVAERRRGGAQPAGPHLRIPAPGQSLLERALAAGVRREGKRVDPRERRVRGWGGR